MTPAARTHPPPVSQQERSRRLELWDILLSCRTDFPLAGYAWPDAKVFISHGAHFLPNQLAHCIVRHGLPVGVLDPLSSVLDVGPTQLAPLLGVDRTTIRRYLNHGQDLPSHTAETVLRLAEIEILAKDTFESGADARAWLKKPHPMLEGETPLESAATSYGGQRVREILVAIKHGGVV